MESSERFLEINKRLDYLRNFYPFFKIYSSSAIKKQDYDTAYLSLDILTLLIEKGRLQGRALPIEEIESHMCSILKEMYPNQDFDGRIVTRDVLSRLETDVQGMLYQFQYVDPIRKKPVDHFLHFIEYDVKEKAYRITDDGLTFMISTKELPEESKISVTLILFKKQIESGSFRNALHTLRDLNLEVQLKKRKKQVLLDKIMYGDPDIIKEFESYTQGVLSQLKQENELFTQVRNTLLDLSENHEKIVENPNLIGKEEDFIIITDIATELEYGYTLHNSLLKDYTDFSGEYERICQIRMKSLFERRYQFQEALENHIRENLSNEIHIVEMHPMFLPKFPKQFNLIKIFESQVITGIKDDIPETRSNEKFMNLKFIDGIVEERQTANYKIFAYFLITALQKNKNLELINYLESIENILGQEGIENIDLIPFLIDLNSGSEIRLHNERSEDRNNLDPFETHFDLTRLQKSEGSSELIETALYAACDTLSFPLNRLRVIADPCIRVPIGGEKEIYISNMRFIGE